MEISYGEAIRSGFQYLLKEYPDVFIIGQGLWSPWYVGNSMTDLEKEFGKDRVRDTPVSEAACTGAAVGASLVGMRPIVVHPRMDFMLYAMDSIVNQAAKWRSMVGGSNGSNVTIRGVLNRGGEQGAQHSQALHAWFAHIPGLRVVMPYTVADARDLLVASVLSSDPVVYIDDRWLYSQTSPVGPISEIALDAIAPVVRKSGEHITVVASGYSCSLAMLAADTVSAFGISCDVIDMRVISPLNPQPIIESVRKTGRLLVIDGGWRQCGFAGEIIASVVCALDVSSWKAPPCRITLPDAPAPSSGILESNYYPSEKLVEEKIRMLLETN